MHSEMEKMKPIVITSNSILLLFLSSLLAFSGCTTGSERQPLQTVDSVQLTHYLGTWKEIYRIPNRFQDGEDPCKDTAAIYRMRKDGKIVVRNRCQRQSGPEEVLGLAEVVEDTGNSRLRVNFTGIWLLRALGIGDGNYYILALGPVQDNQYQWALVGEPQRKYGWILARQSLSDATLEKIFQKAVESGYERKQFRSFRAD